jgi:hypothetical protein
VAAGVPEALSVLRFAAGMPVRSLRAMIDERAGIDEQVCQQVRAAVNTANVEVAAVGPLARDPREAGRLRGATAVRDRGGGPGALTRRVGDVADR